MVGKVTATALWISIHTTNSFVQKAQSSMIGTVSSRGMDREMMQWNKTWQARPEERAEQGGLLILFPSLGGGDRTGQDMVQYSTVHYSTVLAGGQRRVQQHCSMVASGTGTGVGA